jgi:membrane fusion protein (multidrug efflux system)
MSGEKMVRRNFASVLVLALTLLGAGCNQNAPGVASAAPADPVAAQVPPPASKAEPIVVSGPLVVEHEVDVDAQHDGIVASIEVEPGQRVRAGALLAQLDDRQITANLEAARARTRSIEADLKNWEAEAKVMQSDYDRAQKMWDAEIITKEQLEHAKFKAESETWDILRVKELLNDARQTERSLELDREKTRISAPFDSLVARRYVRAGQQVAKGDRLFWVTAEAPLRLRFTLPEKYLGRLHKGQEVPLSSPDVPEEKHIAKVIEVSPVVDPASGTVEILVEVMGTSGQLRPGMAASVRLDNLQ